MLKRFWIFASFIVLYPAFSQAGQDYQFDIGGGMQYYAGKTEKSLAPNSAVVVRFGAQDGEGIFRGLANLYVLSSSGEADFDDQGTTRELTYKLIGGEFNIGFGIYPLGNFSKLPLQPYFGAGGSVHIDSLSFDKDADVSDEFPKSDSPMSLGYSIFVGTDLAMSKNWGFKVHVEQSNVTGTVAGTAFSMGGQRITFGIYFE